MATFDIKMPKLGESVEEATITKWFVKAGDMVEEDQVLLEIATDKVDSEIPSPVSGKVIEIKYPENAKIAVGKVIAVIDTDGSAEVKPSASIAVEEVKAEEPVKTNVVVNESLNFNESSRFYSPLVRSMAKKEQVSLDELEKINGTGHNGRVKKEDLLHYLENRTSGSAKPVTESVVAKAESKPVEKPLVISSSEDEIIEMGRMRRIIADHMVMSKQVSPHVTNVVEADVTSLVMWRNKNKDAFEKKQGVKLTYMPVFIEAVARALKEFPMVNASVDGYKIILRKNVNVGVAVALPNGGLIVPVIRNADLKNIAGLAVDMNELAEKARKNKLSPDDIQGGTFTITNFGTFRNLYGTPIINQPQVAILATGSIVKKPAVLETPQGDVIAIRHKMYLALTFDHRIIDGVLGGTFLRRIADILEQWDESTSI
ncbi:MAG TPA: dihydrolipoamide acetyltransferase family protein [Bacteroidales bacterium]|mgnify:CR=1 FL=1|nr:dihydrolipoamide acetyltransferase family protein [Bacteroidales bacterium]